MHLFIVIIRLLLVGVATYYPAERYAGQPLYCNYQDERLVYDESLEPWIAVDVELYRSGRVQCGDLFLLAFSDGRTMTARAWDAGTFDGYYVITWPELPIVVDLPEHLRPPGGAARVTAFNLSAWERVESEICTKLTGISSSGGTLTAR